MGQALDPTDADFKEDGDCSFTGWPVKGFSPAFLGALIGSLIRPLGGHFSDKFGGARVTHYHTLLMTIVTACLGIIVKFAREATKDRMHYFPPFFICFLILFYCTGVGHCLLRRLPDPQVLRDRHPGGHSGEPLLHLRRLLRDLP